MGSWRVLPPLLWAIGLMSHVAAFFVSHGRVELRLRPPKTTDLFHHDLSRCAAWSTAPTMGLLRTFEASELQLQRFIGELGFVEITDWYVVAVQLWQKR